jgi:hypothetical protein
MHIYRSSLLYMHILPSVYAHFVIHKCAFFPSLNAHIRKRASVFAHFGFCIRAFTEAKMCIYRSSLPYMHIFPFVYVHFGFRICVLFPSINAHIQKPKCTYTEAQNVHIQNLSSVYAHFVFLICVFTEVKMRIYGSSLSYIELLYIELP